jgi:hypothetical protein
VILLVHQQVDGVHGVADEDEVLERHQLQVKTALRSFVDPQIAGSQNIDSQIAEID